MPSSSCAATATATTMMTTTSPSPTFPTTHAFSSNADYDTPQVAAAAAVAEPTLPPSIPDPQNEDECVLCCYPFPLKENGSCYKSCCGELICQGCIIAQKRTLIIGTDVKKPIAGSKEEDLEFITILESAEQMMVCPFCRAKSPTNDKEYLKRIWKQIDEHKDPIAMIMLGGWYQNSQHGLSKNLKKAEELYQQAYDLGDALAANFLADLYTEEIPDQARIMKYLEEGVKRGNTHCNNYLGFLAAKSGKHEEATRQLMTAARSGHEDAMSNLMLYYRTPGSVVSKEDLATTLRTHQAFHDKGKSEPREYAIRLKAFKEKMISTGKMQLVGNDDKRK